MAPTHALHLERQSKLAKLGRHGAAWQQDALVRAYIWTLALILTWYVLSTSLSIYNKQLVGKNHGIFGKGAFPAPLFMSSVQFGFQTLLAKLVFKLGWVERTAAPMTWKDWSHMVLPNGVTTGLDIGLSNKSLVYITMSFYTMCKSTVPCFLLLFAFIWGLEKPSWELAGVVSVIVSGLLLLVKGETDFNALGFFLVMSASCLSGLRFTLTQVLLHGSSHTEHVHKPFGGPLEILEVLTPVMAVTTFLLSLVWEQLWVALPGSPYFATWPHCAASLGIIFAGAVIAFLMVWTEYQVIKETSALTFMIAGTCKEVVTVVAAVLVMGDKFGLVNGIGLVVVICGVALFNVYRYRKLRSGEAAPVHNGHIDKSNRSESGSDEGTDSRNGPAANGSSSSASALITHGSAQVVVSGASPIGPSPHIRPSAASDDDDDREVAPLLPVSSKMVNR